MATPLLEGLNAQDGTLAQPALSCSMNVATGRTVVTDCPAYAWRNADDASRCYHQLPDDFVHDYRALLDEAVTQIREDGTSLFGDVLAAVWAEHGYTVEFVEVPEGDVFRRDVPMETHWKVWDEAAYRLDADQVVKTAGLVGVRATYTDTEN